MNYYYFGLVIVGTLIKLTGIVPWVAYNLAVPTLFALTGAGRVLRSRSAWPTATGRPSLPGRGAAPYAGHAHRARCWPGWPAIFFVAIIGNLGNAQAAVRPVRPAFGTARWRERHLPGLLEAVCSGAAGRASRGKAPLDFPNDWWFWNASRVIPDTINEFPFFTFTYADLHAHMIALPLTLLALAAAVALVRTAWTGMHRRAGAAPAPHGSEPSPWRISAARAAADPAAGLRGRRAAGDQHVGLPDLRPGRVGGARRAGGRAGAPGALRRSRPDGILERLAFLFRGGRVGALAAASSCSVVATVAFYPYTKSLRHGLRRAAAVEGSQDQLPRLPDRHWGFFLVLAVIYLVGELVSQRRERRTAALAGTAPAVRSWPRRWCCWASAGCSRCTSG